MISIRKPLYFSEIGRKDNQEDYLFPSSASVNDRVFILCDGMGGHENGEVASRVAATALGEFLTSHSEINDNLEVGRSVDIPTFEEALTFSYDSLDKIDTGSPKKPGTTMACLCLNEENYLVAHIGDSRIYHIRPSLFNPNSGRGGIIYQSEDHSLVNDLLKAGELTEEEARNFPHKNVITRAMQPHLAKRYKADIAIFNDIQAGDYFFLCCDGILEQLSNERLCSILADTSHTDEEKIAEIKSVCDGKTRDNYSCWLIPIESVSISASDDNSDIILADEEYSGLVSEENIEEGKLHDLPLIPSTLKPHSRKRFFLKLFTGIFVILAVLWCTYFTYTYVKSTSKQTTTIPPAKEKIKKKSKKEKSTKPTNSYQNRSVFVPYSPNTPETIPADEQRSLKETSTEE